jgi:signal peptidase I
MGKQPKRAGIKPLVEWVKSIAYGFAIFLVIRAFIIQTWVITSGSMEHTLLVGDLLVLNKVAYGATVPLTHYRLPGYTQPQRRDVIVFRSPADTLDLIKRLIGLPGDTLQVKKGELFINGSRQLEPYVEHTDPAYTASQDNWGPVIVPPDSVFVMGDNRDNSYDSRYWGFLARSRVKGKAAVIYYSYDREAVRAFSWLRPRWSRIGTLID